MWCLSYRCTMMVQTILSHISIYGLLASCGGIAVCFWLFSYERRCCDTRLAGDIDLAAVYGLMGAVLGAKILYLATIWPILTEDLPLLNSSRELFFEKYLYAGFVYYGGLIGYFGAINLYGRFSRIRYAELAKPLVPALALFHAFGRLGCLLQGCCYGIRTQSHFAAIYHNSAVAPRGVPLFPVQLIEAGLEAAIFALLLNCLKRGIEGDRLTAIYLITYGSCRFVLEFFRGDSYRGIFCGFSLSQYISLFGIATGIVMICAGRRSRRVDSSTPE